MMTESEAKQRWCPFVRFKSQHSGSAPAHNRDVSLYDYESIGPEFACIGSRCMAWQWVPNVEGFPGKAEVEQLGRCCAFPE